MPSSYEVGLVRAQLRGSVGIFGCDDWRVYSNESLHLMGTHVTSIAIEGPMKSKLDPYSQTVQNKDIFIQVWAKVITDPRAWSHAWLVKADPDTVFLPDRLRGLLRYYWPPDGARKELKAYLNNCPTGFHGPIEVLSTSALAAYNSGRGACQEGYPADSPQEDAYLGRCLDMLKVDKLNAFNVLDESHCGSGPGKCKSGRVSFHPFKTVGAWMRCWNSATR